jgi:hypothetical protein
MRWQSALLTVCSALVLAACGGGDGEQAEQQVTGPPIDSVVAEGLAERSDRVASLLDEGDNCSAQREAGLLRTDLNAAIADKTIPELYLEDLSSLVNEIQAGIPPCEPPPLPPPTPPTETHDGGDGDD